MAFMSLNLEMLVFCFPPSWVGMILHMKSFLLQCCVPEKVGPKITTEYGAE